MKVLGRREALEEIGATAVFVSFDTPERLREGILDGLDAPLPLPFPIVVDEERDCYERWGLKRARWHEVWLDPGVWKQYARLLLRGESLRRGGRDTQQLGGDFVVGREGEIVYSRPQRRDDRPPVGELVAALRECM